MDPALCSRIMRHFVYALRDEPAPLAPVDLNDTGSLDAWYPVSEFATASIAAAAQALQLLRGVPDEDIKVDGRLAALWFSASHRPVNRPRVPVWDAFAGDYPTQDGWIRLHTNAPHHRRAMEHVLGISADKIQLAKRIAGWNKIDLEEAIIAAGGCAAAMRTKSEWDDHPQAKATASEPLYLRSLLSSAPPLCVFPPAARPLLGIKVLDLTRIIAGPVATRFLAGLGANVLRIDPPGWEEPAMAEETMLGKRCARLDLKNSVDRQQFQKLLAEADVLVHSYRADALDALGYDSETRQKLSPGLVDVSLNAWGWSGPWRNRRGFDSLVQMACGMTAQGQQWQQTNRPVSLPVQALDHATGYLLAAAVLEGLRLRRDRQVGYSARLSLAATARELMKFRSSQHDAIKPIGQHDWQPLMEWSTFGLGQRLRFPLRIAGMPVAWSLPPRPPGSDMPDWQNAGPNAMNGP